MLAKLAHHIIRLTMGGLLLTACTVTSANRPVGTELCAGGFYTLYDTNGMVRGDTNAETTAYAVLALCAAEKP